MSNVAIQCEGLTKRFGATAAVDDVTLQVDIGKTLALLSPSGCGKTTLLRLIAGFEAPDSGAISIRGRKVVGDGVWVPPEKRHIGFVFQDYALFPHLSVEANIAFGLKGRADRKQRTQAMLDLVGLADQRKRMPHELSGGQQQRVAFARALAPDPDVILFDEPFSNLDAALRRQMRDELERLLQASGATAIFVTHDQEEALSLGATVAIMRGGKILDLGTPRDVYIHPRNREVAELVGPVNVLEGESKGDRVECVLGSIPVTTAEPAGRVHLLLRPESIQLASLNGGDRNGQVTALVEHVQFHGNHQHVLVRLPGGETLRARVGAADVFSAGEAVTVKVDGPILGVSRGEK